MQLDDAAAVAKARSGDEDAFRLLVERHSRHVYRVAYRMTGRPEDAEDVVQETLVRAYKQLSRFEARANFATWLHRIAFNCAIDFIRRRSPRELPEPVDGLERLQGPARGPAADDLVFASEIDMKVREAMTELSAQERAAFIMRHHEGCSIEEIGAVLDLKANAVKHSIFRAVRKMRTMLRPIADARPAALTSRTGAR